MNSRLSFFLLLILLLVIIHASIWPGAQSVVRLPQKAIDKLVSTAPNETIAKVSTPQPPKWIIERIRQLAELGRQGEKRDPVTGQRLHPPRMLALSAAALVERYPKLPSVLVDKDKRVYQYDKQKLKLLRKAPEEFDQKMSKDDLGWLSQLVFDREERMKPKSSTEADITLLAVEMVARLLVEELSPEELLENETQQLLRDFLRRLLLVADSDGDQVLFEEFFGTIAEIADSDTTILNEHLMQFLTDSKQDPRASISAAEALEKTYNQDQRQAIIDSALVVINDPVYKDPRLVAYCVKLLVKLKATECMQQIRSAFEKNAVDIDLMGGYVRVLHEMGLPIDKTDAVVKRYLKEDMDSIERWKNLKKILEKK